MALLFSTQVKDQRYEVRSAGKTLRLYTNGVFHSQWNPGKPLAGHLWDLLVLPIFFTQLPQRVLVLGVGGGAAINTLNVLSRPRRIDGVDLDPVHLDIARRYFACDADNVSLLCEDAAQFVRRTRARYDLIIEDVFAGTAQDAGDARRVFSADSAWISALAGRLSAKGSLVMNFETVEQLRACVRLCRQSGPGFAAIYGLQTPRYENAVGVFLQARSDLRRFKTSLRAQLSEARSAELWNRISVTRL